MNMRNTRMNCGLALFLVAPLSLLAQTLTTATQGTPQSGAPVYVLYRLFFRDVAQMDTIAAQLDAAGKSGGDKLRGWYQQSLVLTADEAAVLKQSAVNCNQALAQHQQQVQPVVTAVQSQLATLVTPPASFTPPPQLVALETQRTAISNTCIQNLHSALGDRKFTDIDVFVRTKFAQRVSAIPPFANAPITRIGAGK